VSDGNDRYELVRLERTCDSHPSQWDGWDAGHRYFYIRYRHGVLTVDLAADQDEWRAREGRRIYVGTHGGEYDSEMTTAEMLRHTQMVLAGDAASNLPDACWLCSGKGAVAVHNKASEHFGKTLFVAHRPQSASHPVMACPVCRGGDEGVPDE
jgi:hypothetical protein